MYAKVLEQRTRYIVVRLILASEEDWVGCTDAEFVLRQLNKNAIHKHDDVLNIAFIIKSVESTDKNFGQSS